MTYTMKTRPMALVIPAPETITVTTLDQWLDFWANNYPAILLKLPRTRPLTATS